MDDNGVQPKDMAFLDFCAPDGKGRQLDQFHPKGTSMVL